MTEPIFTDQLRQLRSLNDDLAEPMYWIYCYSEHDGPDFVAIGPFFYLVGYKSSNGERYRWCSYDLKGKEYVEWDSAVDVDMNTQTSSVQNVENPPMMSPLGELVEVMERLKKEQGTEWILYHLKLEMQYQIRTENLMTERTKKLMKALDKFDVAAALELSK